MLKLSARIAGELLQKQELAILQARTTEINERQEKLEFVIKAILSWPELYLLKALNARMTILVVSHDVAFISRYVSRVACVNSSRVTSSVSSSVEYSMPSGMRAQSSAPVWPTVAWITPGRFSAKVSLSATSAKARPGVS
mgnify:CR=1 FL=1